MAVVRHYIMVAKPDEGTALLAALVSLAVSIRQIDGCTGIELLRDAGQSGRFVFMERWINTEAYEVGSKQLPKWIFSSVMAALSEPPEASNLENMPLDELCISHRGK